MISFLKKLRMQNVARCNAWHGLKSWSVMEWGCAMAGEAGEACNEAKKIRRIEQGIAKRKSELQLNSLKLHKENLAEEIADTVIYLDLLAAHQKIDIEKAVKKKFNSVSKEFGFKQRI